MDMNLKIMLVFLFTSCDNNPNAARCFNLMDFH